MVYAVYAAALLELCSGIVTGIAYSAAWTIEALFDHNFSWSMAMQKFVAGAVLGAGMGAGTRALLRGTRGRAMAHRFQGELTSWGESLARKLRNKTGHTFKMEALMNHISEKLGALIR